MIGEVETFAAMMDAEMRANEPRKGTDWRELDVHTAFDELVKHADKLLKAVAADDAARVAEHAADVGNCAMFVALAAGALRRPAAPRVERGGYDDEY